MGYTFYDNKVKSPKKELDSIFNTKDRELLLSRIRGNIYYGAIQNKNTLQIYAVICKFENRKFFGYKKMTENEHPFFYNCPKNILNILSETDNENALSWRFKVSDHIKKSDSLADNVGKTYIFDEGFKYNGAVYDSFILKREGSEYYFYNETLGKIFRIKNIERYNFKVV